LRKALEVKRKNFEETGVTKHAFWDALVFRKVFPSDIYMFRTTKTYSQVKAMLGGQILIMTTGSAPIDGKTLTLIRTAFCCDLIEGCVLHFMHLD
jgi:long-chain acyl-CoA synthetase